MAGIPIGAFLDEIRRAGILRDYHAADVQEDLEWATRP